MQCISLAFWLPASDAPPAHLFNPWWCRYEEGANLSEAAPVVEVGQVLGLPGVEGYVADAEAGREEVESDDAFAKYT